MSDTMMALAWKAKGLTAEEKLLLLAIADEADSRGRVPEVHFLLMRKLGWEEGFYDKVIASLHVKGHINSKYNQLVASHLTNASAPPHTPPSSDLAVTRERPEKHKTKTSKPKNSTVTAPRARNPIWDAVAAVFGPPLTKSEQSDFGKTVKELNETGADPADIAGFKPWWDRQFPDASCTHRCLRLHWASYKAALVKRGSNDNVLDL